MKIPKLALALFTRAYLSENRACNFAPIYKPCYDEVIALNQSYTFRWNTSANYTGSMTASLWAAPCQDPNIDDMDFIEGGISLPIDTGSWKVNLPEAVHMGQNTTYRLKVVCDEDDTVFNYSPPFHFANSTSW